MKVKVKSQKLKKISNKSKVKVKSQRTFKSHKSKHGSSGHFTHVFHLPFETCIFVNLNGRVASWFTADSDAVGDYRKITAQF